ncbi:Ethanolamine ammonia-lyase light chain [Pseudodesulfovibrio piezophilus C1TLV30]|uniref:Ethanolamine ammonia-lyase small subunit n=2 Tax=Pseudodesulfovibrio TaxID=2035811 RepID=M1WLE7_PSEP2|nr:Ethanolamine ammonia-lyase light chain [Pseudodesulfovibrio piezophilus C1TLV30]
MRFVELLKDMTSKKKIVTADNWDSLKKFTDARISLGRCGTSLPLKESLAFKLAHAQAKDAVHKSFQRETLIRKIESQGYSCISLKSQVENRNEYLTRPDLGRQLDTASLEKVIQNAPKKCDISFIICDGLSVRAIHENGLIFFTEFMNTLKETPLTLAPVCLVTYGRVAIADEIGAVLNATLSIVLIGERPGLSAPNSMGIYLTYAPKVGNTDEVRNCISNIRPGGMTHQAAVQKLSYLLEKAYMLRKTGVQLKDSMPSFYLPFSELIELQ